MTQQQHQNAQPVTGAQAMPAPTSTNIAATKRFARPRIWLARWTAALALVPLLVGLASHVSPVVASTTVGGDYTVAGTRVLSDFACATATNCYAVGQTSNFVGVIVPVTNNGIPGSPRAVPGTAFLGGIACPTSTTCYAVGTSVSYQGVLVTLPVGGAPTVQPIAGTSGLSAIACPSSTVCEAVGPGPGISIAPSYTTIVTIPTAGTPSVWTLGTNTVLNSIACMSQTCYAVGVTASGGTQYAVLITVPASGTPTTESISLPGLQDITCAGTTCYAVGGPWVVALHQDGSLSTSQTATVQGFSGIVCPTASFCAAVGLVQSGPVVVINPASATPDLEPSEATLERITCRGSSGNYTCYAVGASGSGTNTIGAVETISVSAVTPPPCKTICQ